MTPAETFAQRLRERRLALHLTQGDLGRAIGVSTTTVCTWERGALPRADRLKALAHALGVSSDRLLGTEHLGPRPAQRSARGSRPGGKN